MMIEHHPPYTVYAVVCGFDSSFLFWKILREDKEAKNKTITQETAAAFLFVQWKKTSSSLHHKEEKKEENWPIRNVKKKE
jgi:hypothetical protein